MKPNHTTRAGIWHALGCDGLQPSLVDMNILRIMADDATAYARSDFTAQCRVTHYPGPREPPANIPWRDPSVRRMELDNYRAVQRDPAGRTEP